MIDTTQASFQLIANHLLDIHEILSEKIKKLPKSKQFKVVNFPGGSSIVEELAPILGIVKTLNLITNTPILVEEEQKTPILVHEGEHSE